MRDQLRIRWRAAPPPHLTALPEKARCKSVADGEHRRAEAWRQANRAKQLPLLLSDTLLHHDDDLLVSLCDGGGSWLCRVE
jgi:hypothetical protein